MRWRAYPRYKDSGVEWLSQIPDGWSTKSLRSFAEPGNKTFIDGDWIETPYITTEGVRLIQTGNIGVGRYREQGFRYVAEETFHVLHCTEVLPGDILICRLAEPVGRACVAPDLGVKMITSVDVTILKPSEDVCARFVVYSLSCDRYLGYLSSICRGGTRDRVSRSMLGSIRIQCPPLPEQRAIAAFLDRETARIDALIAKKRRQIELLQEKRSALITRAVTKGLDPNAPMKDSGVEWLGEVPAHWHHRKLGYIADAMGGSTPSKANEEYWSGTIPWVSPKDMKRRVIEDAEDHISEDAICDTSLRLLPPPVVLMVVRGMILAHSFPVAVTTAPVTINQDMKALKPKPGFTADYIAFLLEGIGDVILSHVEESAHGTRCLRTDLWKNISVFIPGETEQAVICAYLHEHISKLDQLTDRVSVSIERFREYRSALVSAAVTGQIDVRQEVT